MEEPQCSADTTVGGMIDQQQLAPMVCRLDALPNALGAPRTLLANSGHFSVAIVEACTAAGIEPLNAEPALGEAGGAGSPFTHLRASASPAPDNATSVEAMAHRLAPEGKRSTPCASRRPNRCSAPSKPSSASNSSRCAGSTRSAANGGSLPWPET